MYETNSLTHHGILGMKWGVRRYQNKDGSLTAAGRKRLRKLEKKQAKLDKKMSDDGFVREKEKQAAAEETRQSQIRSIHDMSDQDLSAMIQRMTNEKKLQELMKEKYLAENPPPKQKERMINGRKIAGDILTNVLTERGKDIAGYGLGTLLNKAGKEMGLKEDVSSKGYRYIEKAKEAQKERESKEKKDKEERRQKELYNRVKNMSENEVKDAVAKLIREEQYVSKMMQRKWG